MMKKNREEGPYGMWVKRGHLCVQKEYKLLFWRRLLTLVQQCQVGKNAARGQIYIMHTQGSLQSCSE